MRASGFADCVTREIQHLPARLAAREALAQGRLEKSVTSQLGVLTDEEYRHGVDRIREAVESAEARSESLYLTADLRLYATFGAVPSRLKKQRRLARGWRCETDADCRHSLL
jgi:hypothetical protein